MNHRASSARRLRAGAEAEFNSIAIAVLAVRQSLIADAASLVRRISDITPADGVAFDLPKATRDDAGTGERCRAVGEVNGTHRLAGDRASCRRAAQGHVDEFAAEVIGTHRLAGRRFPATGQHYQGYDDASASKNLQANPRRYSIDGSTRSGGRWPSMKA